MTPVLHKLTNDGLALALVTRLGPPLRDARTAAGVVGLVALAVFANALGNRFAYDDWHIVVNNPSIQSLETLPGALIEPYWPGEYGRELGLWRPTTTGLLGIQHVIGGGSPLLFHVVNVVGHALTSVLVFLLLLELMSLPAALAAGLIFAVHPVHVEAVANIIGISEIASTAALLLACLVHVRGPARSGWLPALGIGALYAFGFGAKESAVTLPGLIFLLDAARRRIAFGDLAAYVRDRWRVYLVMVVVAGGLLAGRYEVLGSVTRAFSPLGADLLAEIPRIWTLAEIWPHYVRLWILPLDLSADYSPNVIPISIGWHASNLVGLTLALGILAITLAAWRRPEMGRGENTSRAAAFGVVWFIVAISPISNALFLSGVLLAERTLYLPSVGLAAATGWLVVRLARERPRSAWILLTGVILLGAARTWTRTPTWRDNQTMLATLVEDYPHSGRSQWILGDAFLARGATSQALTSYRAAINILGGHYQLLTEISKQLMRIERYGAAESLLRHAWRENPEFPLAPGMLAAVRAELGDAAGTELFAKESLVLYESDPTREHLLAWALAAQGRWDEARAARRRAEALARAGFWQQWMYLAYVRWQEGDTVGALALVDSAWVKTATEAGRTALDSARVADFGLEPLLTAPNDTRTR